MLLDLKEARRDWDQAISSDDEGADDRASEADQRTDELRDEFASQFKAATGLTWKQVEEAIREAIL